MYLVWVLFCTGLWLPINWSWYGNNDWDLTYTTFEISRKIIVEEGSFPVFNPYLSFGSDLLANPQSVSASIFMLPVVLFGTFYGYKVSILAGMMIGLYAMRRLLGQMNTSLVPKTLVPMVFCSASYFGRHIIEAGHSNFLHFYLIPLALSFLIEHSRHQKPLALVAGVLILSEFIVGGAPFAYILSSIILGIWSLFALLKTGNRQVSVTTLSALVFAFLISAWKVLPVLNFWEGSPRLVKDDDFINVLVWLNALEDNPTNTYTPHHWHEFSIGMGSISVLLILYYRERIQHFRFWLIAFVLILWLSLGNVPPYANPWYLMHHYFPVFDSLRAPSRFGFLLLLGLCTGLAITTSKNNNQLIYLILLSIVITNTLNYNSISRNLTFSRRIGDTPDFSRESLKMTPLGMDYPFQFKAIQSGRMIPNAYEPLHLSAVSDTPTAFNNHCEVLNFQSSAITLKHTRDTAFVSLRYDKNWQIEEPESHSFNHNGLLGIAGSKGGIYHLRYSNPKAKSGLIVSLISLVALLLLAFSLSAYRKKARNLSNG